MFFPLKTERLSIKPLSLADLDSFVEYRRNPAIARFQSWEPTYSTEDARTLIESQDGVSIPEKGQWLQLAINHRETGDLVGDLALHSLAEEEAAFELGFTIGQAHQRQGFATEAASMLMQYLFTEIGAVKLVANSDRRNTASVRLLETLGFERVQSRSWTENFKNEEVTMDHFETR